MFETGGERSDLGGPVVRITDREGLHHGGESIDQLVVAALRHEHPGVALLFEARKDLSPGEIGRAAHASHLAG